MFDRETQCAYRLAAILSLVVCLTLCVDVSAQSGGTFGQRQGGQQQLSTITSGRSSFSGTTVNNFEQEGVGSVTGSERFVRDARQPGEFVGADSGDARNFFSQQSNAFQPNFQPTNRNANRQNAGQSGGQQNGTRTLRRRLHAAFRHPQLSSADVRNSVKVRLNRLSTRNSLTDIQVAMQGRTALLQGTVASEEERKLAAILASLEPGVSEIRNELVVSVVLPPNPRVEQVPVDSLPSSGVETVPNSETAEQPAAP
jgi:osmotically-inducible protein OsmY